MLFSCRKRFGPILVALCLVSLPAAAVAEDRDCGDWAAKVGHGGVIWTRHAIVVQGTAAPDLSDPHRPLAAIKRVTRKAAALDAYRRAAGVLAGVRVTSSTRDGGDFVVEARIDAHLRNARECSTKYYADGGVDLVVMLPLTGAISEDLLSQAGSAVASAPSDHTGLVVDVRHLSFSPALVPGLLADNEARLFGVANLRQAVLRLRGAVHYVTDPEQIQPDWVGDRPLHVKARRLGALSPSDIVVDEASAAALKPAPSFLGNGRIVIMIKPRQAADCQAIAGQVTDRMIDWQRRLVLARGTGKVDFARNRDETVRMRAMERAAELDAQRKLAETLLQVRIDGSRTLEAEPEAAGSIHATVLNATRCQARYFRDGTAEIVMAAPLDALMPVVARGQPTREAGGPAPDASDTVTGLVVDATGTGFVPVLTPIIAAPDGTTVYGAQRQGRDYTVDYGPVGYQADTSRAWSDPRVAPLPLVIRVQQADNASGRLVVSADDARRLRLLDRQSSVLARGRVVVVTENTTTGLLADPSASQPASEAQTPGSDGPPAAKKGKLVF